VISAVGEIFATRRCPDQDANRSELVAVNSYPRLLAMMLTLASSMVGVRPPKLPSKVVRYHDEFCVLLGLKKEAF